MVLPFCLTIAGFSWSLSLSFTIGVVAILTDGLLTKIALKLGCKELNPSFMILSKKVKEDTMLVASRVLGIALLSFVCLLFQETFIVLFLSLPFMVCIVANSFTLVCCVRMSNKVSNENIDKPNN